MTLALVHHQNVEENTRIYVKAASMIDPQSIGEPELCRVFVIALINAGELEIAEPWAERFIAASGSDPKNLFDALWHRGVIALRDDDDVNLIRYCDRMLKLQPENENVLNMRSDAMLRLDKFREKKQLNKDDKP